MSKMGLELHTKYVRHLQHHVFYVLRGFSTMMNFFWGEKTSEVKGVGICIDRTCKR